jgi:predicted TIM-barrel fold metal-dependent hydrolase
MADIPIGIVDAHCHVSSQRYIPRQFLEGIAANMAAELDARGRSMPRDRLLRLVEEQHGDHHADRLVAEMDAAGIGRAVLLIVDFGLNMDTPATPAEMAGAHDAIRRRHPGRFHVFMGVDPRRGAEGIELFEHTVTQYGFEGLKLYPACGFSASDPILDPYYEICRDRKLPVFLHTGPTVQTLDFRPAHPLEVDTAARRFPGVNFILGHGGVSHVATSGYLAQYRENVYLDIGGFGGGQFAGGWERHLRDLFRLKLNHKVVFGTDWPLNRMSGGLERLLPPFLAPDGLFAGVRPRERALVMAGNICRLLGVEVPA